MALVINARFLTQQITGVQRYGIEISRELKKKDPSIRFLSPSNILHRELASELDVETIGKKTGHYWEQFELPSILNKMGKPLLLNLANTAPLTYKNKISTIHDISFERFPENFSWAFRTFYKTLIPRILSSSKIAFTVSEFSKKEICSFYNLDPMKVEVIPNAAASIFCKARSTPPSPPFILAVSSLNRLKNFSRLIDAFSLIEDKTHNLYLIGDFNKNFADPTLLKKIESNPRIVHKGRVTDEELINLYSSASAFVYPSIYEGFGIPPLEAQACGCPTIVSNVASLPEVCGDSALYCSPLDITEIAEKIDEIVSQPLKSKQLTEKGYINVGRFSWSASAEKLLKTLQGLS